METSLKNYTIWIVDDSLPVELLSDYPQKDELLRGECPIDRGLLWQLTRDETGGWSDDALKSLCVELIQSGCSILGFTHPAHLVSRLKSTGESPDVIVFDLEYRSETSQIPIEDLLAEILGRCFCLIQVYTEDIAEQARTKLARTFTGVSKARLSEPQSKGQCNAAHLAELLRKMLSTSFSARAAQILRVSTRTAIERLLVKMDLVPPGELLRHVMGNDVNSAEKAFELIAIKLTESLEADPVFAKTIEQYLAERGFSDAGSPSISRELTNIVVSHIRERIKQVDLRAFAVGEVESFDAHANLTKEEHTAAMREFYAFRLYSRPSDDIVRTGDILVQKGDPASYFMIITPQCDLERFGHKTRGVLTAVRIYPLIAEGVARWKRYGGKPVPSQSITAKHPFVLPSVPIGKDENLDFLMFAHDLHCFDLAANLSDIESLGEQAGKKALMYADSRIESLNNVSRICHISEPFVSGLLNGINAEMFRSGIPDHPKLVEKDIESILTRKGTSK